jgi:hypothetical protein
LACVRSGCGGEELDDGGVVQPGVTAIGHPEKQVRANMVYGTGVTGAFHGFGECVDVPAGHGHPIQGKIVTG